MRVLSVRPGQPKQDIAAGRRILQAELDHPSRNVMVIRGNTPTVAGFADLAATRSDPFPWREVIWVQDGRIFRSGEEKRFFGEHTEWSGVVLDFGDQPVVGLTPAADVLDIEQAFLKAQTGQ